RQERGLGVRRAEPLGKQIIVEIRHSMTEANLLAHQPDENDAAARHCGRRTLMLSNTHHERRQRAAHGVIGGHARIVHYRCLLAPRWTTTMSSGTSLAGTF